MATKKPAKKVAVIRAKKKGPAKKAPKGRSPKKATKKLTNKPPPAKKTKTVKAAFPQVSPFDYMYAAAIPGSNATTPAEPPKEKVSCKTCVNKVLKDGSDSVGGQCTSCRNAFSHANECGAPGEEY